MIEFASPSIEQNMPNATLPTEPETRWKMGKLADENAGLRMELDAFQNRNYSIFEAMNRMLSDLLTAQEELEEKKVDITRKENELLSFRQDVDKLSTELIVKEEELKKEVYALLERETSWKAGLHDQREQLEAHLKGQEECAQVEIEQHQIRTRPAETQLLESEAQIKA